MTENVLRSIEQIELEADQVRKQYQDELDKIAVELKEKTVLQEQLSEQKIKEYKDSLDQAISAANHDFLVKVRADETDRIEALKKQFEDQKEVLIQRTVKEVLTRYGNC